MIVELKGAQLFVMEGYTCVVADRPEECTECHRMTQWFTNRGGQTSCLSCDIEKGYSR